MKLKFILFLIIFYANSLYAKSEVFLPKAFLILPQESIVKVKWILPPEQSNKTYRVSANKIHFVMDYKNEPIIIYNNTLIINPLTNYIVKLIQPVKEVICLDSGVLIFSDHEEIGYIEVERNSDIIPSAKIKAITKLPLPKAKLFKGDNTLYAVGYNKKVNKYELYIFNPQQRLFKKITTFDREVHALSGKEEHIYFSQGNVVNEYKEGRIIVIYEHPREKIENIFYNEKTGLIYQTSNGIGIIKNNAALEFLQAENPIIFLKEISLYVFFPSVFGVLEIMNIDDLKNFNFKVRKIIDIQQIF